jgi:anti-anti-sigma regulatory factor
MLRITANHAPPVVTLQLEGRLAGPWVAVLEECWQNVRDGNAVIRLDLRGLTSMDAAGRTCLMALHRQGAKFRADGLTEAVVAEITESSATQA